VVSTLGDSPEVNGKLTLTAASIHVEGSSTRDVDLSDVLEANFSDAPFELQYFDSEGINGDLPTNWTAKPIDDPAVATGSASFKNSELTVTGDGANLELHPDHFFFAGMPWNGDGQWTAHMKELTPPVSPTDPSVTEAAVALRSGLDAGASLFGIGVTGSGDETLHYGRGGYRGQPGVFPIWFRLTRSGKSLETSYLSDKGTWEAISEDSAVFPAQTWIGFMVNSCNMKASGSAVIDQISFTPTPAQPEIVPPGVLLTSGTYLAGDTFHVSPTDAGITHGDKDVTFKTDQLSAAIFHPITMRQVAAADSQQGVVMLNGDFMASDIQSVGGANGGGMVQMSSIAIGSVAYYSDRVCAFVANPVHLQPSNYEVRLVDGSIIRAKSLDLANGKLTIQEISGIAIDVDPKEIAQIRAGLSRVQPLIDLPLKISGSPGAATTKAPASSPPSAGTQMAATETNADTKPAAPPAANAADASIVKWTGPNREQILVLPAGAKVEVPLKGKFQALAMRLAVAPGAPANAEATLRVLIAGKEVACTPAFIAGAQPRSMRLTVTDPQSITLAVDSAQAGTRLLLIDPIAIRTPLASPLPASAPETSPSPPPQQTSMNRPLDTAQP
jgi:hypothetical protein